VQHATVSAYRRRAYRCATLIVASDGKDINSAELKGSRESPREEASLFAFRWLVPGWRTRSQSKLSE
jgi:hypothetical protein